MLQLFHLSVAKVDLDVGLLSEEERASAHGGGDVKEGGVIRAVWKRRSRVIQAAWAAKWKGAGPNAGAGSGA
jgi:hypothetical protein